MSGGPRRRGSVTPGLLVLGSMLVAAVPAGCGSGDAAGLARQACSHVSQSLALYDRSLGEPPPAQARDQAQALQDLQAAQPLAATAAGQDGRWQALMTSISESSRLSEGQLESVLRLQCAAAQSGPGGPINGGSTPTSDPNHYPTPPG